MSSTGDQQQAVGNGLAHTNAQLQKRHSSGEHVDLQIKLQASEQVKDRRQSSSVLHGQHISLHHRSKATASKPTPPPHPSVSPELAKLANIHKSQASNDIHVIDSRSKNAAQACTSPVPPKSTKCPPKRPDPPKHSPHTQAPPVPAPDPPKHSSTMPNHPSSIPPSPTPSPPPTNTTPIKSKRIPVRRAPPPPSDKASSKSKSASTHQLYEKISPNDKATSGTTSLNDKASSKSKSASAHKTYEKVFKSDKATPAPNDKASSKTKTAPSHKKVHPSSNDKATPSEKASSNDNATPLPKKISVDNKIAPLLEQFERACSNDQSCPVQMPGALYSAKPPSSSIPKSQSTDILSPEKTSFPKSQSTDLLSPTSLAIPKSQSTDLLMPQISKSQSSAALKAQKSVIPKSQSSAVLKSHMSSLPKLNSATPKQNSSTPKQDSSSLSKKDSTTSKPPSKSWKPKNSKLQALFHKAERRKRKKTKEEKVAEKHQEAKRAKDESHPLEAIYAVVQKVDMDDSLTPQTAALYYNTKEQSSQTPGSWIPPEEVPPTSKDPNCEIEQDSSRKLSQDNNASNVKFTVGSQYSSEDVYASIKKRSFKAKEEEMLPPLPPRLYENIFDDPSIAECDSQVYDMERGANHDLKAQLQESMDNTYAVMHNPRSKGYGDMVAVSSEQEEQLPPLPPRLYENIFDDPSIAVHAEQNIRSNDSANHNSKAQRQESMDNTYEVMHNPRIKGSDDNRRSSEQEELPPLPPKLYVNVFDNPTAVEHKHDSTKGNDQEELPPPPLPPKLYENIFDDQSIAEHTAGDTANIGNEQEELPPPLPPKLYENVFDDAAGSTKHDQDMERGATRMNGATSQDSKAQLQESADNTYAVMHNPRSKVEGESAKSSSDQEDIYIVMHPHPAFMPLIKKYFKNPKSK